MASIEEMNQAREKFSGPTVINVPIVDVIENKIKPLFPNLTEEEIRSQAELMASSNTPIRQEIEIQLSELNKLIPSITEQVNLLTVNSVTLNTLNVPSNPLLPAITTQIVSISSAAKELMKQYLTVLDTAIGLNIELPDAFVKLGDAINLLG